jgi:PTH1 family peptidyl-tRNA hydrolase
MKGSHGGHNGVRSVLDALGTQEVRRVKIGIGRPTTRGEVPDHVLDPFERDELPVAEQAVAEAADRILALIAAPRG